MGIITVIIMAVVAVLLINADSAAVTSIRPMSIAPGLDRRVLTGTASGFYRKL